MLEKMRNSLGLLGSRGGWAGAGEWRRQGLEGGEELRGLGLGWEMVRKGESALRGFSMATHGGAVMVSRSARGHGDLARRLVPIRSTQCVLVTVSIPPSRPRALVCPRLWAEALQASFPGRQLAVGARGTLQREHCLKMLGCRNKFKKKMFPVVSLRGSFLFHRRN